jgi:hypothetical protein
MPKDVVPPGAISGAEHPELISDETAIKAFLLAVAVPSSFTPEELATAKTKLVPIGLNAQDSARLLLSVQGFADAWGPYRAQAGKLAARIKATGDQQAFADHRMIIATIDQLVSSTFASILSQLSADGVTRMRAHIERIKSRIWIIPSPDMTKSADPKHVEHSTEQAAR